LGRGRRGLHFAHGAGFAAGRALLGLAAGVHLIAAFFTGKDRHDKTSSGQRRWEIARILARAEACGYKNSRFYWASSKIGFSVILNGVKDLNLLKIRDSSLRSE
jgi:hypothetical protein